MNKLVTHLVLTLAAVVLISCSAATQNDPLSLFAELDREAPANTLSKKEARNKWQLLFDGENTTGWRGYNMTEFPADWIIDNGTFTMTTTGGGESLDIITDKTYRNFAFSIEFKVTNGSNSGIIFQVKEDPKYKFPYETGPEFQVTDHERITERSDPLQICGANYAMYAPRTRPYKPLGEWNQVLLVVNENHVTHILNGEVIVEYEKYSDEWTTLRNSGKWNNFPDYGKFDVGHIALQNHGTRVWYRNIKIKEL